MKACVYVFLVAITLAHGRENLRTKVKSCGDGTPQPKQVFLWNHEEHCYEMPCLIDNHHHLNLIAKIKPAEDVQNLIINTTLTSITGHVTHKTEDACKLLRSMDDSPGCPIKAHEERLYFVRMNFRTPINEDSSVEMRFYNPSGLTEYCFITDYAIRHPGYSSEEADTEDKQGRQDIGRQTLQENVGNRLHTLNSEEGGNGINDMVKHIMHKDEPHNLNHNNEQPDSGNEIEVIDENSEENYRNVKDRGDKNTYSEDWTDLSWIRQFIKRLKALQALKNVISKSDELTFGLKGMIEAKNERYKRELADTPRIRRNTDGNIVREYPSYTKTSRRDAYSDMEVENDSDDNSNNRRFNILGDGNYLLDTKDQWNFWEPQWMRPSSEIKDLKEYTGIGPDCY